MLLATSPFAFSVFMVCSRMILIRATNGRHHENFENDVLWSSTVSRIVHGSVVFSLPQGYDSMPECSVEPRSISRGRRTRAARL